VPRQEVQILPIKGVCKTHLILFYEYCKIVLEIQVLNSKKKRIEKMEKKWFKKELTEGFVVGFLNALKDAGVAPEEIKVASSSFHEGSYLVFYYFYEEVIN